MSKDVVYDAGNEEHVVRQRERGLRTKQRNEVLWLTVLKSYEGRYVINCILEEMARPFELSFNPDNSRLTDFREGERNVGNQIIARAFGDRPALLNQMRVEHLERKKEND